MYDFTNAQAVEKWPVRPVDPGDAAHLQRIEAPAMPQRVPCFTAGSLIKTARGEVRAGDIVPGDRLLTRDNGYQTVIWRHREDHIPATLCSQRRLRPMRVPAGALGPGVPAQDTWIAPQQRLLFSHYLCDLLFGVDEVLIAPLDVEAFATLERDLPEAGIGYVHILLHRHELVQADGIWVESFQPTAEDVAALPRTARHDLLCKTATTSPVALAARYEAARTSLKPYQIRVLTSAAAASARGV